MFNRWKFIRRYATFRCRASFLSDNVKEKKRRKYYNIEYFSFNAKIRETVTSNGVNRKVNIKLHSRIYQRSRIYIYLLPHASLSLSLFYFHNGDKCDLRESHRSIRETKNVFERFERMRLENEKREKKTKTTMEIKTRSTVGTKREEDGGEFWASRGEVVHPDAIVRFSLVVLCHHISRLTICPRIRFQILPRSLLGSTVYHFSTWPCFHPSLAETSVPCPPKSHR